MEKERVKGILCHISVGSSPLLSSDQLVLLNICGVGGCIGLDHKSNVDSGNEKLTISVANPRSFSRLMVSIKDESCNENLLNLVLINRNY